MPAAASPLAGCGAAQPLPLPLPLLAPVMGRGLSAGSAALPLGPSSLPLRLRSSIRSWCISSFLLTVHSVTRPSVEMEASCSSCPAVSCHATCHTGSACLPLRGVERNSGSPPPAGKDGVREAQRLFNLQHAQQCYAWSAWQYGLQAVGTRTKHHPLCRCEGNHRREVQAAAGPTKGLLPFRHSPIRTSKMAMWPS